MNLPDTYRIPTSLFSKLICLMLCGSFSSASVFAQLAASASAYGNWNVSPRHLTLNCVDSTELSSLPQPLVQDISGQKADLSVEDQYFNLTFSSKEWTNYFAVSRWEILKIKGDGGVDVTGAPNAILVEGANSAQVSVDAESELQFNIVIPADGFISLDYENFGGSNLLNQVFTISAGGATKVQKAPKSKFFSSSLRCGDVLSLRFDNPSVTAMRVQLSNLRFFTNAAGVWERRWTADNAQGERISFPQFITIEKASITDVSFPDDVFYGDAGAHATQVCTAPVCTGFPFVDRDGNPETTFDRQVIDRSTCDYNLSWSDELVQTEGNCILERRWTISDAVSDNLFTTLQRIHLPCCPTQHTAPGASELPEMLPQRAPEETVLQAVVNRKDS